MPPLRPGLLLFVLFITASNSVAQEWTRFRGPNGTGLSESKTVPDQWSAADYNWRIKLPGGGHSSPVLWGKRIFLTAADATDFSVLRIDEADGKVIWKKAYPHGEYNLHKFSSFASATCTLDSDRVYFTRQDGNRMFLCALSHDGEPVWEVELGAFASEHGSGHSPIVYQEKLVLAYDQAGAGRILAVDRKTGRELWSIPRKGGKSDYSVPYIFEQPGKPPVLVFNSGEDGIAAVDPATGRIAWKTVDGALRMRSVSSPISAAGLTFATCGSGGGGNYVIAIRPPASGSGEAQIAYEIRKSAPYVPTPIAYRDRVFLWSDGGIVTCIDPASGETRWQERVGGNYFSSPVCVNGRLYGTTDMGEVVVIAAADEFKLLSRHDLGELTRATPAVANGRIYFRTWEHLVSVGGSKPATVN